MATLWKTPLLLIVALTFTEARNSFLFLVPAVIRPGNDLSIRGSLLKQPTSDVTVTFTIQNNNNGNSVTQTRSTLDSTNEQSIYLEVPRDLAKGSYSLKIEGTGGVSFTEKHNLRFEEKSASVFIQTDKAMYKPGQTVRYRTFAASSSLQTVFDKLRIVIKDPKGHTIQQLDISNSELTTLGGVYEGSLPMSDHPVLGDWTIQATLAQGASGEKTFTIAEYVLPKFETKLDLPSFGRTADREFHGSVTAKYTHGNDVKGDVNLRVTPKASSTKSVEQNFPIEGKAKFRILTSQLRALVPKFDKAVLVFEVNTTEGATGVRQSDTKEIRFYDNIIKVEYPKSLPKSFKPGMTYTAVVKVAQQDDTPPPVSSKELKVTVTYYRKGKRPPIWRLKKRQALVRAPWMPKRIIRPPPPPSEISEALPPRMVSVPADGIVEIPLDIPSDVIKAVIKAEYDNARASHTIKKRYSPSNSYLQVRLLTPKPKAGSTATFEVTSTASQDSVSYQVYSKGRLVESAADIRLATSGTLAVSMASMMAPRARIIVFYVRPDGEVVADALSFNVDGLFDNKVSMEFNVKETSPDDTVSLRVSAEVGSKVNVLAVDKSVLLLKAGNDISLDEVRSELETYASPDLSSPNKRRPRPICDWFCWRWPIPTEGDDVKAVFDQSGLLVFTDATVYEHREDLPKPIPLPRPIFRNIAFSSSNRRMALSRRKSAGMAMAKAAPSGAIFVDTQMAVATPEMDMMVPPSVDELQPVAQTRKEFPETWLWLSNTMKTANWTIEEKVPDTITSWVATAFAVHPLVGLGLTESPATLLTSLPFFITTSLPYSVVRGEKVVVKVLIFNYSPSPLFTYVTMEANPEFENIHLTRSGAVSTSSGRVQRFVQVQPNDVATAYFPITPVALGMITLNIVAQNIQFADAIEKRLLVEPEGAEREYNVPVLVDLKQTRSFDTQVKTTFPPKTVLDSRRVVITAVGDLMGPTASNLDSLLKMPYGCGEQNMLKFAPNIFILHYLESTNNLKPEIMEKAKEYMIKGYQRELTYQHKDGSFSAFGERDPSGSMWLTAFVLKSFVNAKPYIFIDDVILERTVDWIIDRQNSDGSFPEPGRVLNKKLQGGATGTGRALTAYVLVALVEAETVATISSKIPAAKSRAISYLERDVATITDLYELSILSYALTLAGSGRAQNVWNQLNSRATTADGMKYWAVPETASSGHVKHWERRKGQGKAINIEITAYALLALDAKNERVQGIPIVKWLMSQRNPNGGFSSTQDTVVALQALSEMAQELSSADLDMTITLSTRHETGQTTSKTARLTASDAMVLKTFEFPGDTTSVHISATGRGIGLVDVQAFYNIESDDQNQSFSLAVTVLREDVNSFEVQACARWLREDSSAMSLIEVGSPSGFFPEVNSVVSNSDIKRTEEGDRKIVFYFDEIGRTDTCVTLTMFRYSLVAGGQPVPVRVYDYYEPVYQVTEFYIPDAIRNSNVCQVCKAECDFCSTQ